MMDKAAAALFSVYRLFAVLLVLSRRLFSDSPEETDGLGAGVLMVGQPVLLLY